MYSDGPFSFVFFFTCSQHSLRTYTYRRHREMPARSAISLPSTTDRFTEVFVDTSLVRG